MSKQGIEQHIQQYKNSNAFIVLDGATIPNLLNHLYVDDAPEFECLYEGELEPDIAEVAPYLVKLGQNHKFDAWVYEGWGLNWGIYVMTSATVELAQLRRHLRKLNKVYSPDYEPLHFRYYDPSILQLFLPSCSAAQLNTVFGPITALMTEASEMPSHALCFTLVDGELVTKELEIMPHSLNTPSR